MEVAIQKFGGTSLHTAEMRARVCEIISRTIEEGFKVVAVVSAMGREKDPYATDTLIKMAKEVNPHPSPRELDLLMSCGELISGTLLACQLSGMGIEARLFNGRQAGIVTDGDHGNAHIVYVNPGSIMHCLENNVTPVVAGFQGISEGGEITTLGRGGSDTTASALGVALAAKVIDVFTDVDGVMTADPRIVSNARLLDSVTYNEVCQLAREGAKVIHPRAVEIAMQANIPLRVRSTTSGSIGTLVSNQILGNSKEWQFIYDRLITGITYTSDLARIRLSHGQLTEQKDVELRVFKSLAQAGISVDFINVQPEVILFTVPADLATRAVGVLKSLELVPELELNCAKVAVVGAAMTGIPGVMARVVEALSSHGVPILQSGDSYTNIWCLVKKEDMETAVKALHDQFELGNK